MHENEFAEQVYALMSFSSVALSPLSRIENIS